MKERKKRYGESYRSELSDMLVSYGIVPYRDLKFLPKAQNIYSKKLSSMAKERRIRITELRDGEGLKKVAVLRGVSLSIEKVKNENDIEEDVVVKGSRDRWYDYFEQTDPYNTRKGIQRHNTIISDYIKKSQVYEGTRQMRAFRIAEVCVLMQTSGIKSLYYEKPRIWDGEKVTDTNQSYFYMPCELTYEEIKDMQDEVDQVLSRYCGIMITPGRDYTIFHMGPRRLRWSSTQEFGYKVKMAQVINKKNLLAERTKFQDAIFYVNHNSPLLTILNYDRGTDVREEKKNREDEEETFQTYVISIKDDAYDNMYVLYVDGTESKIFLHNMTYVNWEEILMEYYLPDYECYDKAGFGIKGSTGRKTETVEDGTQIEEFVHLYCLSEIKEFYNFLVSLDTLNDIPNYRFKVVCYEHQYDLVKELTKDQCLIETVPMKKIEDILTERFLAGCDTSQETLDTLPFTAHGVKDNVIYFMYVNSYQMELYTFLDELEEIVKDGSSEYAHCKYKILCYAEQANLIADMLENYEDEVKNKCEVEIISRNL